jgi:hypothetical protein
VLAVAYTFNLWRPLLVGTLVPLAISGMLQTLNKFEQHLGLHGQTVLGLTRTVVDRNRCTEVISAAMLYNDYHGTHHRYAKIPYYHLPSATPFALAGAREYSPVFPNIVSAFFNMLGCLRDPKAGPQWNTLSKDLNPADSGVMSFSITQPVFTGTYEAEPEHAMGQGGTDDDSINHVLPHQRVG